MIPERRLDPPDELPLPTSEIEDLHTLADECDYVAKQLETWSEDLTRQAKKLRDDILAFAGPIPPDPPEYEHD